MLGRDTERWFLILVSFFGHFCIFSTKYSPKTTFYQSKLSKTTFSELFVLKTFKNELIWDSSKSKQLLTCLFKARWMQIVEKSLICSFLNSKLSKTTWIDGVPTLKWPYLRLFELKPVKNDPIWTSSNKQFLLTTSFSSKRSKTPSKLKNDLKRPYLN